MGYVASLPEEEHNSISELSDKTTSLGDVISANCHYDIEYTRARLRGKSQHERARFFGISPRQMGKIDRLVLHHDQRFIEAVRSGEMSVRQASINAGLESSLSPYERALEDLCRAWERASLEDRQAFLLFYGEDIMATEEGEYVPPLPVQRKNGPHPYVPAEGASIGPLEELLQRGETVSGVARRLGVSHRTVCRWRSGATKPGPAMVERLAGLVMTEDEGS